MIKTQWCLNITGMRSLMSWLRKIIKGCIKISMSTSTSPSNMMSEGMVSKILVYLTYDSSNKQDPMRVYDKMTPKKLSRNNSA